MKIGVIYYKYPLYEKGSYIQEFVDALAEKSEEVILISSPYPSKNFNKPKNLNILWIPILKITFAGDIVFNIFVFFRAIFSNFKEVNVINVVSARGAIAAYLLGKIYKKPVICSIEIINSNENNNIVDKLYNIFQKFVYSLNYDKIICWSEYYYDKYLLKWGISESKVVIISGGINILKYNPNINGESIRKRFLNNKKYLIVFAKPMYEYNRKTAELLLESVALLRDKLSIQVLLGTGEQRDILEKSIRKLKLSDNVSFMPFVSIDKIPLYLAASDVIVLPFTYAATTARSLLEAMAIGKPIITTRVGEISKIVKHKKEAILTSVDKKEISKAIELLISNKTLAEKIGYNARVLIKKKYSIESIVSRTVDIFGDIIKKYDSK